MNVQFTSFLLYHVLQIPKNPQSVTRLSFEVLPMIKMAWYFYQKRRSDW